MESDLEQGSIVTCTAPMQASDPDTKSYCTCTVERVIIFLSLMKFRYIHMTNDINAMTLSIGDIGYCSVYK